MVNIPTRIPDCDSHSPAPLNLFFSSDASICSTMAFPPLGNSDHVVVSVSIKFASNSQRDVPFHCIAYDYSCVDWGGIRDHLTLVFVLQWLSLHWEILIMFLSQFPFPSNS